MKELLEKILGQIQQTPDKVRAYEDLYYICLETKKTDIPLAVEYLKKLSDSIESRIPQSATDKELRSLFMLHKKVLLAAAPFDFESYLLYVEWEREPDKKFYVPRREVMHPVVQAMQDLIDDRLDLLTISMPPADIPPVGIPPPIPFSEPGLCRGFPASAGRSPLSSPPMPDSPSRSVVYPGLV